MPLNAAKHATSATSPLSHCRDINDLLTFGTILEEASLQGDAARSSFEKLVPQEKLEFAKRVLNKICSEPDLARLAFRVAVSIEHIEPRLSVELAYGVIQAAKKTSNRHLQARAICHIAGTWAPAGHDNAPPMDSYDTAFKLAFSDIRENRGKIDGQFTNPSTLLPLLPSAGDFLELIVREKRWELGAYWTPVFKRACPDQLLNAPSNEVEKTLVACIQRIEKALPTVPHERTRPRVIHTDINALIKDAKIARDEKRFGAAELILVAGMKRLGSTDPRHFSGSPEKLPLLVKLAAARIENFFRAAELDEGRGSEEEREVGLCLCQRLAELFYQEKDLPKNARTAIHRVVNDPNILRWLRLDITE